MNEAPTHVYLAGHTGLVGSAILKELVRHGIQPVTRSHAELDLTDQGAVRDFFRTTPIDYVILAAARVGGIMANSTFPADFIRDNLSIALNVIDAAHRQDIDRLLFLGSSCIYPRLAEQPIREEALLTGPLEPTNESYAVAKIAGIKLCQALNRQHHRRYLSLMPTNLYGPGDNFDPVQSHVVPALVRRFSEATRIGAPEVVVWGTGTPRRELLYVGDLARACVHVMETHNSVTDRVGMDVLNVGTGEDLSVAELAAVIANAVSYPGRVVFDPSKPDGTPRKLLDVSRLRALGWSATTSLPEGLRETVAWYQEKHM